MNSYGMAGAQLTGAHGQQFKQAYSERPVPADKPRIHHQLDQLEKLLEGCHQATQSLDATVERIIGPVPENGQTAQPAAPYTNIEQRLAMLVGGAELLYGRLSSIDGRLRSAV